MYGQPYGPPPGQPYGTPASGQPYGMQYVYAPPAPTEPSAVTAMVLGIVSIVMGSWCGLSMPLAIPGLILANRSLANIRASGGMLAGHGMAMAGKVTSIIGLVLGSLILLFWILYFGLFGLAIFATEMS